LAKQIWLICAIIIVFKHKKFRTKCPLYITNYFAFFRNNMSTDPFEFDANILMQQSEYISPLKQCIDFA
jgi:hypothetical protein